jgi:hypothetical protein
MAAALSEDGLRRVLGRAEEERDLLGLTGVDHLACPRLLQGCRSPVLHPFVFHFTTGP